MASFCRQCYRDMFDEDDHDFRLDIIESRMKDDEHIVVICEGCGIIQINSKGECVSSDCLKKHRNKTNEENNINHPDVSHIIMEEADN